MVTTQTLLATTTTGSVVAGLFRGMFQVTQLVATLITVAATITCRGTTTGMAYRLGTSITSTARVARRTNKTSIQASRPLEQLAFLNSMEPKSHERNKKTTTSLRYS